MRKRTFSDFSNSSRCSAGIDNVGVWHGSLLDKAGYKAEGVTLRGLMGSGQVVVTTGREAPPAQKVTQKIHRGSNGEAQSTINAPMMRAPRW